MSDVCKCYICGQIVYLVKLYLFKILCFDGSITKRLTSGYKPFYLSHKKLSSILNVNVICLGSS